MARRREVGACEVTTKAGGVWTLARDQYASVRHALISGVRIVDTRGLHGEPITMVMDDVDGLADVSADVYRERVAERIADAAEDDSLGSGVGGG